MVAMGYDSRKWLLSPAIPVKGTVFLPSVWTA